MKKTITILAATVGAVLALSSCGTDKASEAVANAPQPTVTVTAPAPPAPPAPTVTVTAKADSQSVPQACLDALDNADEGFGYAAGAMSTSCSNSSPS